MQRDRGWRVAVGEAGGGAEFDVVGVGRGLRPAVVTAHLDFDIGQEGAVGLAGPGGNGVILRKRHADNAGKDVALRAHSLQAGKVPVAPGEGNGGVEVHKRARAEIPLHGDLKAVFQIGRERRSRAEGEKIICLRGQAGAEVHREVHEKRGRNISQGILQRHGRSTGGQQAKAITEANKARSRSVGARIIGDDARREDVAVVGGVADVRIGIDDVVTAREGDRLHRGRVGLRDQNGCPQKQGKRQPDGAEPSREIPGMQHRKEDKFRFRLIRAISLSQNARLAYPPFGGSDRGGGRSKKWVR